jgi:phosphate-selective porin OprO/OprP
MPPPSAIAVVESAPAVTQDNNLDQRVKELEETIRRLESRLPTTRSDSESGIQDPAPTMPGPGLAAPGGRRMPPVPLETGTERSAGGPGAGDGKASGWDNGFFLRSADGAYQLRITGQIQSDLRDFGNDHDQTDISNFLVRRARLGIEATVARYYEFRLLPDFGLGRAVIQDAYLNVHYLDAFQIAAGKLKQPVSYEELIQDRFVPTVERSIIDQLVPGRDVGVMVHGYNLFDRKLDYAFGVFNGGINSDLDTNGYKDFAWRIAVRPLNFESLPAFLHLAQLGISGTTGVEEEPMNPMVLRTPASVPFFTFNPAVRADGLRNRWTPELSYFYRGLGFAAQYYYETQELTPSLALSNRTIVTVPFEGYYLMATYLLTGEERSEYSQAVRPLAPFDPLCPFSNPGAWEVVARYSRLDIGDVVFAPGAARLADPTKSTNRAAELTLGYNWYLNAWVRMQFNWEHAWFANGVPLGAGLAGWLRSQDSIVARLQVIF